MRKRKKLLKDLELPRLRCALLPRSRSSGPGGGNTSYTYNYDYWGDVQDSPDLYTVSKVFTSSDLGLEQKMNNPQGLYVYGDLLYVCDTGNNRILELKRHLAGGPGGGRIIDSFKGDVETTFSRADGYRGLRGGQFLYRGPGQRQDFKAEQRP